MRKVNGLSPTPPPEWEGLNPAAKVALSPGRGGIRGRGRNLPAPIKQKL